LIGGVVAHSRQRDTLENIFYAQTQTDKQMNLIFTPPGYEVLPVKFLYKDVLKTSYAGVPCFVSNPWQRTQETR
jgi:hypothetical protein